MAILIRGLGTSMGAAVAACLASERGRRDVEELGDSAPARVASSDGVILCGAPDPVADPELVPRLIGALAGTGQPLVYASTAWVMGDTRGRLAGEAAPLRPPPSLAWLAPLERILFDAAERRVRAVVVRPAVLYGAARERAPLGELLGVVENGRGENHWSFVHAEDLAELMVLAWEGAPAGSLFVVADGPPATRAQLSAWPLATGVAAPPGDAGALDQRVGSTRAFRELGWRPSRPPVLRWLAESAGGGAE